MNNKELNVISLFDGISAGQLTLNKLEKQINKYYASEIDLNAIKVTQSNFSNTIQLGDIKNWINWDIDFSSIDLILFGFPCQSFSICGKRLNFEDERGKLFFYARDILNYIKKLNPNVQFLAENVPMKKEIAELISEELGIDYIEADSACFSPQTRLRYYWTNIPQLATKIDNQLVLKDILEKDKPDDYFDWYECDYEFYGEENVVCARLNLNGHDFLKRVNSKEQKCQTLTAVTGGNQHKKVYLDGRIRKLTTIEYARLQGFPDNYCNMISKSAAYKAYGNSWNIPTVKEIIKVFKLVKKTNL